MIYNLIGYEEIDYRGMNEWIILQIGNHDTEELGDALDVEVDCDLGDTRVYFGKRASLCLTSKDEIRSEKFVELATGDVEKIPKNHNKRDHQNETKNFRQSLNRLKSTEVRNAY
jgi:hypothetical protein